MARTRSPVAFPLLLAAALVPFDLLHKLTRPAPPGVHTLRCKVRRCYSVDLGVVFHRAPVCVRFPALKAASPRRLPVVPTAPAHDSTMTPITMAPITTAPKMSLAVSIVFRPRLWPPVGGRVCLQALGAGDFNHHNFFTVHNCVLPFHFESASLFCFAVCVKLRGVQRANIHPLIDRKLEV